MMQPRDIVHLTENHRETLQQVVRAGKTENRVAQRARMLLLADEGENNSAIAERLGVERHTVQRIRSRYGQQGLEAALQDAPRSGRPRVFSP
jgi:LuxR family maltose regulon positive regulatory protein